MYDSIPKEFLIVDLKKNDFKKKTFNGYKKSELFSELEKSILSGNIEKSILWLTELHCSGYLENISNKLLLIYFKHINKANLNIISILVHFNTKIINKIKNNDQLSLRNDQFIRNNIHDLLCILTFSPKYKLPKLPNIKSEFFNMENNKNRLLSKNLDNINQFIKNADDKNIIIPLAEILENIKNKGLSKSLENCLFWLNWILIYEKNFHNGYILCTTRPQEDINSKFLNDFTWILWEIFFKYCTNTDYLKDLFILYKQDFKKSKRRQKIDIIILALLILIDPQPKIKDTPLISQEHYITKTKIIANINYQYLDITQNKEKHQKIILNKDFSNLYSPLFSNEKFLENNVDQVLKKYTKTDLAIKKVKSQEQKNIEKNKKREHYTENIEKIINNVNNVRSKVKRTSTKLKTSRNINKNTSSGNRSDKSKNKAVINIETMFSPTKKFSINDEINNFKINH